MASDPELVNRLHAVLDIHKEIEARRMFGGVCFTLNGNMCVGIHNKNLIIRVGPEKAEALMKKPHVKPMDLTGKVMKGWATVLPDAVRTDAELIGYAQLAIDFVRSLPRK